jgi:hypothetical protein
MCRISKHNLPHAYTQNGASVSGVVSGMSTLGLRHNDQMGFVKRLKCEFKYTVKYHARLKSDRSPTGSDGVRQKGLGFNL